jgi:hypothetical protein
VIARRTFSTLEAGGHSWEDYIYSPPTLYATNEPCAISLVNTVLSSQTSPYLPTFHYNITAICGLSYKPGLDMIKAGTFDISETLRAMKILTLIESCFLIAIF